MYTSKYGELFKEDNMNEDKKNERREKQNNNESIPVPSSGDIQLSAPNFSPMNKDVDVFTVFGALLKSPETVVCEITKRSDAKIHVLSLLIMLACMTVYGFLNGTFSGGIQLLSSTIKFPAGWLLSGLLCFPSLYIFLALSGADINFRETVGLLVAPLTISSILLVGFGPILWIFSQSTNSIVFMGVLNFAFWVIAAYFGLRLLHRSMVFYSGKHQGLLNIWIIIFLLVVLQMTTTLRPIIGESHNILPSEKQFFLMHWIDSLNEEFDDESSSSSRTSK
jgi:hypothetical protein